MSSNNKVKVTSIIADTLGLKKSDTLDEAYVAQPKSFDHATELISDKSKTNHRKLYEGYISALNNTSAHLDTADRKQADMHGSAYRSLKLDETNNVNAVWLHELFFANMSDIKSEIHHDSLSFMRLERDFGGFDSWQWDILACAKSSRNGWAICGYHMFLQRYVNVFIDANDISMPMGLYPVIVIDVHEHAYVRDYLNQKNDYLNGQMIELNWHIIDERFKRADNIAKALKA